MSDWRETLRAQLERDVLAASDALDAARAQLGRIADPLERRGAMVRVQRLAREHRGLFAALCALDQPYLNGR